MGIKSNLVIPSVVATSGEGGGSIDENKVIVKSSTMPTASADNLGKFYIYSGESTSEFTKGYVYNSVLESKETETVDFETDKFNGPANMFWAMIKVVEPTGYEQITNGTVVYIASEDSFAFDCKDSNGNSLTQFTQPTSALTMFGYTIGTFTDGESFNFTCFSGILNTYFWNRLDVQPSSSIREYKAASYTTSTTLIPNKTVVLPNIDNLTEAGTYLVTFDYNDASITTNLAYLCTVSVPNFSGTVTGAIQTLIINDVSNKIYAYATRTIAGSTVVEDWTAVDLLNSNIEVDQTYNPNSTNAQSGTAVAEAVAPALKNKATGDSSLSILGSSLSKPYAIAIGQDAQSTTYGTQLAKGSALYAGVSVGFQSISGQISVSIGANATTLNSTGAIAIGGATVNSTNNTQATATRAIAIGSYGYDDTLKVQATAQDAIQLGVGTNAIAKTLQVFEYQLLDGNTGLIPPERLGTNYDATKTQVLKHINGVLTWVDE